jgi:hypothetical protein
MLKPSAFILALFAMFSTSVLAQDLRVCPNVQVGETIIYGVSPSIYGDCSTPRGGGSSAHWTMISAAPFVLLSGLSPADFNPTPVGDVPVGERDRADFVVENMGPNYTGTCSDMAASIPSDLDGFASRVDGSVYCGRISTIEGHQLWLRGTVDVAGNTWKDPIVLTNKPGVGTPYSPKATVPVPVFPFWGLLSLAGLIGLFGFRKFRA